MCNKYEKCPKTALNYNIDQIRTNILKLHQLLSKQKNLKIKVLQKKKKERKKNAFSLNMFVFNLNQDIM